MEDQPFPRLENMYIGVLVPQGHGARYLIVNIMLTKLMSHVSFRKKVNITQMSETHEMAYYRRILSNLVLKLERNE